MRLAIDASNIRAGGGLTHLAELLRAAKPDVHRFDQIVIWGQRATLDRLEERPWLQKCSDPVMESHFLRRAWWQRHALGPLAKAARCSLLFVPGGSFATSFKPVVTMSQNMLPFEWKEARRYGASPLALKFMLLRASQGRSFRNAEGTLFLTEYARKTVLRVTGELPGRTAIVPHGVDCRFFCPPRPQRHLAEFTHDRPFRLIYVSIVDVYKHQRPVAEAVAELRAQKVPVVLDLVGPASATELRRLRETLRRLDPEGTALRYVGAVPYSKLHERYATADSFVFASSCENLPNILLEAMANGLPIACSNRGPMPEVLGEYGVYFDPERPEDIAKALRRLLGDPELRARIAAGAYEKACRASWERCADQTFAFFHHVEADFSTLHRRQRFMIPGTR
jgi:glycosyltransferase involved in cell wall biosynthesis